MGLLICDQVIQYQYWAFLRPDSLIEHSTFVTENTSWRNFLILRSKLFFRSKFLILILRLFSETKYVLILIHSLFRHPNFQIPTLIPSKKIEKVSRLWHHTRSKHSPVQRSKENPNDIGYQCDDVDPRANLANGHVHWCCKFANLEKYLNTLFYWRHGLILKLTFIAIIVDR